MGLKLKGPREEAYSLPSEIEAEIMKQFDELTSGSNAIMPRADHVTKAHLSSTIQWVIGKYNQKIEEESSKMEEHNEELVKAFIEEKISSEELANRFQAAPCKIKAKAIGHLAKKVEKKQNVSRQSCNTSGNYLPFDDIQMIEFLAYIGQLAC